MPDLTTFIGREGTGLKIKAGRGFYKKVGTATVAIDGARLVCVGTVDVLGYEGEFTARLTLTGEDDAGAATLVLETKGATTGEGTYTVEDGRLHVEVRLGTQDLSLSIYRDDTVTVVNPGMAGIRIRLE